VAVNPLRVSSLRMSQFAFNTKNHHFLPNGLPQKGKANFGLDPLIYSFSSRKTLLHVGTGQKGVKWGLKYVIYSQVGKPRLRLNSLTLSNGITQV
jgi:hypothetical protein